MKIFLPKERPKNDLTKLGCGFPIQTYLASQGYPQFPPVLGSGIVQWARASNVKAGFWNHSYAEGVAGDTMATTLEASHYSNIKQLPFILTPYLSIRSSPLRDATSQYYADAEGILAGDTVWSHGGASAESPNEKPSEGIVSQLTRRFEAIEKLVRQQEHIQLVDHRNDAGLDLHDDSDRALQIYDLGAARPIKGIAGNRDYLQFLADQYRTSYEEIEQAALRLEASLERQSTQNLT